MYFNFLQLLYFVVLHSRLSRRFELGSWGLSFAHVIRFQEPEKILVAVPHFIYFEFCSWFIFLQVAKFGFGIAVKETVGKSVSQKLLHFSITKKTCSKILIHLFRIPRFKYTSVRIHYYYEQL